jgi:hypothetical protein
MSDNGIFIGLLVGAAVALGAVLIWIAAGAPIHF